MSKLFALRSRAALLSTACLLVLGCHSGTADLGDVHADIISDLPTVSHIGADELLRVNGPLILDIREPKEFAVSHLLGAIQIDPDISEEAFMAALADFSGKDVIVYCSVGRRSSIFAERMLDVLMAQGARSVSNLENGIFGWHNEKRELADIEGSTDVVHPYDEIWKRYVERKEKTAYTPQ